LPYRQTLIIASVIADQRPVAKTSLPLMSLMGLWLFQATQTLPPQDDLETAFIVRLDQDSQLTQFRNFGHLSMS
jgi:hypothetical protein